jgi:nucleoside-diphosphate-sugar epimerase
LVTTHQATALVIGGTGPTGPFIVEGLLDRGYDVTILHGDQHEVAFARHVRHLHGDPHFRESLRTLVSDRSFDVVVATYGRLRVTTEVFQHRAGHLVAVGAAMGAAAPLDDPSWPFPGRPSILDEGNLVDESDIARNKLAFRIAEARKAFFAAHAAGDFVGTYLGYSSLYGPRQPSPREWCVIRRVLEGRRQMVVADGGLRAETRGYVENAASGVLLAVDHPEVAGGNQYVISGERSYSMRQIIEAVVAILGAELELVDLPYDLALPCHPLWQHDRANRMVSVDKARRDLGYRDLVPDDVALERTVDWLMRERPRPGGPEELRLGDPFDYDAEDALMSKWAAARSAIGSVCYEVPLPSHFYRHPKKLGDEWTPIGHDAPAER